LILLFASLLVVLMIFFYVYDRRAEESAFDLNDTLSSRLDSAIAFIAEEYEKKKVFETYLCDAEHSDCSRHKFSLFISAAILNSMLELERNEKLDRILKKETERVLNCQDEHLLWDFYCKKNSGETHYYPDLDSTALASWLLSSQNAEHHLGEIRELVRKTQFYNGALLTFLRDFQPPPHAMNRDPVANANALLLLSEEIPSVCEYINKNYDKSIYYTDDVVVFYMLSKAYDRGVKCVKPALNELYTRIERSDLLSADDSPMHLAMFVTAALKSGDIIDRNVLDQAVKRLLKNRRELPFQEYFFRTGLNRDLDFYYSPAFSAAVYAEALTNIKSRL